jgi:hypothetical protein
MLCSLCASVISAVAPEADARCPPCEECDGRCCAKAAVALCINAASAVAETANHEPSVTRRGSFIIADPVVTASQIAAFAQTQCAHTGGSTEQIDKTLTLKMQQDFSRDEIRVMEAL